MNNGKLTCLLDSDVCVAFLRRRHGAAERLNALPSHACAASTVTVFELVSGIQKAQDPVAERQKVDLFLSGLMVLPFDKAAAEQAGLVRSDLERRGLKIGPYDILITAHALSAGLPLATGNVREFSRVPGLRLETWF